MTTSHKDSNKALLKDARMPQVGQAVCARYQVKSLLGVGGFAAVYRAQDSKLGGEVALKVLEPTKSADEEFVQRFHQEIALVRQLRHHNTIKIWDAGVTEHGCLYMATELIEGKELSDIISVSAGGLGQDRLVRIATQVLRSLAEAHANQIVHRDLKPSNIMISQLHGEEDYVKVLDFGIAKALTTELSMVKTQTGMVMCTPAYASPEVLKDMGVKPQSDLYSLGLIMAEMMTGQQIVSGTSLVEIMSQQISEEPITLPESLADTPLGQVIQRAIEKNPEDRFSSAVEMLRGLEVLAKTHLTPSQAPAPLATQQAQSQIYNAAPKKGGGVSEKGLIKWIASVSILLLLTLVTIVYMLVDDDDEPASQGEDSTTITETQTPIPAPENTTPLEGEAGEEEDKSGEPQAEEDVQHEADEPALQDAGVHAGVVSTHPISTGTLLILSGCGTSSGLQVGDRGLLDGATEAVYITRVTDSGCETESELDLQAEGIPQEVYFPRDMGPVEVTITGEPTSVRLYWRYDDEAGASWSDSTRCTRPCQYTLPSTVRPIEIRVRKTNHETEIVTVFAVAGETHEIDLEEEAGRSICNNSCRYAGDGECDDGGPNSLYDFCPLGSDCQDCGTRRVSDTGSPGSPK